MSRAQSYRDAAARLRAAGRRLHDDADAVRRSTTPTDIAAGPAGDVLGSLLEESRSRLTVAAIQLDVLATVCERRAEICDAYARALVRYWSLPPLERPPFPTRHAAWVGA